MKKRTFIEHFCLFVLSVFGWAIGEDNRRRLVSLDYIDTIDFFTTILLVFLGFHLHVFLTTKKYKPHLLHSFKKKSAFSLIIGYFSIVLLNMTIEKIAYDSFWHPNTLFYTTPIYLFYSSLILPYIYITRVKEAQAFEKRELILETLTGKKKVGLTDIHYFESSNKKTYVCYRNGEKSYLNQTLQELESILPADYFFRANRQFIISREAIEGYDYGTFQKIEIKWKENLNLQSPMITVSKYTAPKFKTWLQTPPTS